MNRAWLVPFGFVVAALSMHATLMRVPAQFAVDRAQPLFVITYWHGAGAPFAASLLFGALIAFAGYALALGKPRFTVAVCAVGCACALAAPAIFSSDVYAYAAYGAMLAHGINPYAHTLLVPGDPLLDAAQWQWGNPLPVDVYGPLFLLVARLAMVFAPMGAAAPLWALRACACMALVASVPLIVRGFTWLPDSERVRSAALYALNPAAIWACAEGHNDALALLLVFAGIALMRRRALAGGAVTAIAAAIKAPAIIAACLAWRAAQTGRARRMAGAGIVAGLLVTTVVCVPLLSGVLHGIAPSGRFLPHFSPLFVLSLALARPFAMAAAAGCAALIAFGGRFRAGYVLFAVWFCIPNPYPWYGLWLLAAAAALASKSEQRALVAAALLAMLRYVGEATGLLAPAVESAIVLVAYGIPLMMLCSGMDPVRRLRPEIRTAALDPAAPHTR